MGDRTEAITIERRADCCYLGQGETIQIGFPAGEIGPGTMAALAEAFVAEHRRRWNFDLTGRPVRVVNLRLRATAKIAEFASGKATPRQGETLEPIGRGRIFEAGKWIEMPRYRRSDLRQGDELSGPLIVEEISTRISLRAGETLTVGQASPIIVTVGHA
jgi:N-methylhydantoinase A